MYYNSIEEAIKAAPGCTHILKRNVKYRYPEYAAAYLVDHVYYTSLPAVATTKYFDMSEWEVATEVKRFDLLGTPHISEHPDVNQRVAAARFDTASGRIPAHEFLEKGVGHMKDRASQRDAEDGERSMKRCVEAFNALEGMDLTETQGWKFMVMLKMARSVSGDFTADDYEDMAAYVGLAGESASMAAYVGLAGESASMATVQTVKEFPAVTVVEAATQYITHQPKAHHSDYKYFMKAQNKPFLTKALYDSLRQAVLNEDNTCDQ